MARVFSTVQALGAGLTYDVRPPLGQDWEVTDMGSSAFVGVAPLAVPNLTAGLFDGVVALPALFRFSSLAAPHVRGWLHPPKIFINNTNWLRITNPEAGGINVAISAILTRDYGPNGMSSVISDVATVIAAQVTAVRPPIGDDWVITDVGSSRWVGAQPAGLPNVTVDLTDGINAALVASGADTRGWTIPRDIHINNNTWLTLTNPGGAGAVIGWSGYRSSFYGPNGQSSVASFTAVLGAGAVGAVRPPVGEEWEVTEIGCSVWVGAPPASLPSILVSMTDGVTAPILQQGTDDKGWLGYMRYFLTRNVWMTLTDAGAGSNVGVSVKRWVDA
jgi:hypothetical protein